MTPKDEGAVFAGVEEGFEAGQVVWNLSVGGFYPYAHYDKSIMDTIARSINAAHRQAVRAEVQKALERAAKVIETLYSGDYGPDGIVEEGAEQIRALSQEILKETKP